MNNEIARHDLSNPESSPRFNGVAFSAAVAGCIAVGFLDYLTGYEVSMSVFYALPVIFAVWFCGKTSGILIALLGVAEWFLSDRASGHHYSHEWIRVWNGMVRFAYLNLIVIGSAAARAQIEKKSAEIKVLRGILPICTECKRVRDEMGHWAPWS